MYRLELAILENGGAYIKNLDTAQRSFSLTNPVFTFKYKSIIFDDTSAVYTYVTIGGVLTTLTAPQKAEVLAWGLKVSANDPWLPTPINSPSIEISPRTWANLLLVNSSGLLEGTTCYVTTYKTRFVWDGAHWGTLAPLKATYSSLPPVSTLRVGSEASVSDCGGAIAVAGITGWVFRPIRIRQVSTPVVVTGVTSPVVVDSFTLPANLMGTKGQLRIRAKVGVSSANSNAKYTQFYLGGQAISSSSHSSASTLSSGFDIDVVNVSASSQVGGNGANGAQNWASGFSQLTVNTAIDQLIETKLQLAVGTDSITLKELCVDVQPYM